MTCQATVSSPVLDDQNLLFSTVIINRKRQQIRDGSSLLNRMTGLFTFTKRYKTLNKCETYVFIKLNKNAESCEEDHCFKYEHVNHV